MRYKKRITNLKADIAAQDLDGLLVVKKENIRYLCGLEAEDSSLYISSRNRDYIITDSRFRQEAKDLLTGLDIKLKESSGVNALNEIPSLGRLKRLGFESDHLSFSHYREIKRSLKKTKLVPTRMLIENLRLIKDTEEVRLIKKAIEITKSAYCQAIDTIKPGNNALESAMRIDNYMRENGASSPAFKTIVAEAPFSSRPHAQPIDVPFKKNSSILIDMGAVYNGYNSDLTRLLFLGRITPKFKRIYNIIYTDGASAAV